MNSAGCLKHKKTIQKLPASPTMCVFNDQIGLLIQYLSKFALKLPVLTANRWNR